MKRKIIYNKIDTKPFIKQFHNEVQKIKNIPDFPNCEFFHIGSTSIPNSVGEAILDILIVVKNLHLITNFDEKRLHHIGYHRVAHFNKGLVSFCKFTNFTTLAYDVKVYVVQQNSQLHQNFLTFDTYLRKDEMLLAQYTNFKHKQLELKNNNHKEYLKEQDIFIKKILQELDND